MSGVRRTRARKRAASNVRPPLPLPRLHRLLPHLRRRRLTEPRSGESHAKKRFENVNILPRHQSRRGNEAVHEVMRLVSEYYFTKARDEE